MNEIQKQQSRMLHNSQELSRHYENEYVSGLLLSLIKLTQNHNGRFLNYLLQMAYDEAIKEKNKLPNKQKS